MVVADPGGGRLQQGDRPLAGAALSCTGFDRRFANGACALHDGELLRRCRRRDRVGKKRNEREFENAKHHPVPERAFPKDIVTAKV